ncbi:putative ftsQ protein [Mycobacterium avium subsp. avium 2285 (R)]|uniref:FtsQ protein n=1 Tax=Mycobacterium avium (strain 104) TaxID=243243 RepID=A0A0H2ZW39_MYCA1|nr:FtsQ protein [Mycobacterium avium 104]ETZ42694.1 putative ftsQ protein [Mycobacterium avium MAV_061107_1842]EUA39713.1 putative ftsQ protein [Mycobacterium avium subsp. avium 2285 (R)]
MFVTPAPPGSAIPSAHRRRGGKNAQNLRDARRRACGVSARCAHTVLVARNYLT